MQSDNMALSNLAKPIANCQLISCAEHEWQILGPHVGDIGDADDYCPFCLAAEIDRLEAENKKLRAVVNVARNIRGREGPGGWINYVPGLLELNQALLDLDSEY